MKYLRLALELPPERRHPMHEFVIEHEDYGASTQLHWSFPSEGATASVFWIDGDPEPYVDAIAAVDSVDEFHVSRDGDGFYLFVRDELTARERSLTAAFDRGGLLIVPPIVYRVDGRAELALVGAAAAVQDALDAVPEPITVDVLELGRYDAQPFDSAAGLTDRQREAVRAAADCGYYDSPRRGTVEDVAAALGCAPSTAAEHLRKAESAVMGRAADGRSSAVEP